jgi:hypothetical protein
MVVRLPMPPSMYIYVYICLYVYTHIYKYMYIYIYMQVASIMVVRPPVLPFVKEPKNKFPKE